MKDIFINDMRYFTVKDICKELQISPAGVINACRRLGIPYITQNYEGGKRALLEYTAYKQYKNYVQEREKKLQLARKLNLANLPATKPTLTLEEMKAQHPLVTDERFLRLSFFPDIKPFCFDDLEEEIA